MSLEWDPEIRVAPVEENSVLDTSLNEVFLSCIDSSAIPSSPSQLEWKIGLPWAKIVEAGIPGHNLRIPPQLEKKHVVPPSSQDEALSRYSVSREVPHSVWNSKRYLAPLMRPKKFPNIPVSLEKNTKVPGTTSSEPLLLS